MMIRRLAAAVVLAASALAASGQNLASPRDLWPQVTAAADSGDIPDAEKKLTELLETGKQLGIRRFPLYAESAAALARQAQAEGDASAALSQWAMAAATKLDPDSPAVAFAAADLATKQRRWGNAAKSLLSGFSKTAKDNWTRGVALGDLTLVLVTAFSLSAFAFALILFFRYGRPASHDFRELLSGKFRAGVVSVLAYSMMFLPLFLWLGPMWLMLYWFVLFFPYANVVERVLIAVTLILLALAAPIAEWNAYTLVRTDSPAVRASRSAIDETYDPEAIRRLRELIKLFPSEPRLHLLLGSLEYQDGNESEAWIHFRKASELNDRLAGAHLNIGNLHFLHQDFQAAISQYNKAIEADPTMAIAYYNHAAASGEIYQYAQQKEKLGEAKARDRELIERLLAEKSTLKIVFYDLPVESAWAISDAIAAKGAAQELFASYGKFDPVQSLVNPLTIGSILALIAGPLLFLRRKKKGTASACIKCGRTFCSRCKSAKESATYCTQCIHIYLKRDGVSLDTKRLKLDEVQSYHSSKVRVKKIFTTFLPGSGQIFDGSTIAGLLLIIVFMILVVTAIFIGRLAPIATPADTMRLAVRVIAILLAVIMWLAVSLPVYKQRPLAG